MNFRAAWLTVDSLGFLWICWSCRHHLQHGKPALAIVKVGAGYWQETTFITTLPWDCLWDSWIPPHWVIQERAKWKLQCLLWPILGNHTLSFLQYSTGYVGQLYSAWWELNKGRNTRRQGSAAAIIEAGYHMFPLNFYCITVFYFFKKIN